MRSLPPRIVFAVNRGDAVRSSGILLAAAVLLSGCGTSTTEDAAPAPSVTGVSLPSRTSRFSSCVWCTTSSSIPSEASSARSA